MRRFSKKSKSSPGQSESVVFDQLPEYIRQDPALLVIVSFNRCIYAQYYGNLLRFATRTVNRKRQLLPRLDSLLEAAEIECLAAVERQRLGADSFLELTRQDAHSNQV